MSISTDQYNRLLGRVTKIEERLNEIQIAMQKMVTLTQITQLHTLTETSIEDIYTTLNALEGRVELIENEPIS